MVMNHHIRKLYLNLAPTPTPTTNDQNNIPCSDICVDSTSICPFDCYPYADSIPISPPPPPPEPPSSGQADEDSERANSDSEELVNHGDEVRDDENRADTDDATGFLDHHNNDQEKNEKNGIQSVRRSVSVDSFMPADINGEEVLDNGSHEGSRDDDGEGNSRGQRINGGSSSSITDFLRKRPVRIKRSFTYSGRSFLSRQLQLQPRNNSIIAL